ncbi:ATP-binding domain-containing protein [Alteriqipengyuania flavescens]|uniref:DEAD/DEAH box helicase n=1 Tax=Alteriqipengyuania flavescens TaxID=3053610 RepID=UPI0025B474C6|nr:ATP-binding domain-containing protein [Alteriqipengyuania flavescens]WJY17918.1 ATP-binding domain-containing protein [Alteriqipengyuania flavescens]WJY23859.1 ATP-binding domain-containing protein [Alteriqipengyuania flavescens]
MTQVIWGSTEKPVTSQRLAEVITEAGNASGLLYVGYPVLAGADDVSSIDALWISPEKGVVIFHLVEGVDIGEFKEIQDDFANKLETRLRSHKGLMEGRTLLATPQVITFAPLSGQNEFDTSYPIASTEIGLQQIIASLSWSRPDLFELAHSVIQSISTIRKGRKRQVTRDDSRGAILKKLEDSIANLDSLQSRAVIETVDGVQRIRGLAGSGKTIILALKAAYLHVQNPEWRIAVTFNTRSLKAQFVRLIETFVFEQTKDQPDWENLQVINAWGGPGGGDRTGVYYQFVVHNGIEFWDYGRAKNRFTSQTAFAGVTNLALAEVKVSAPLFDAILIDEAQDFDPSFLRLCYESLGIEKRLVYAYDELQSLTESSLPPPEEIFGSDAEGNPLVTFDNAGPHSASQDIILEKCYRNSGPVLATAHALGFGVYRDQDPNTGTGLVQMFDRPELWQDVGYEIKKGRLEEGRSVTLARTNESSPAFLEAPAVVDDLIEFVEFKNEDEQAAWLVGQIKRNLEYDELKGDDIIVINPDPFTTVAQAAKPRQLLFLDGIQSHVAGVDTARDVFFKADNSVAFTGIFRAKGNEAGMVYVINGQDCYGERFNVGRVRNQLFTAITRSKAWVKVLGYGPSMSKLKDEFERVKANNFQLEFTYPTEETRKHLKVVNRDRSMAEQKAAKGAAKSVNRLIQDLAEGKIFIEDLPTEDVAKLRSILNGE